MPPHKYHPNSSSDDSSGDRRAYGAEKEDRHRGGGRDESSRERASGRRGRSERIHSSGLEASSRSGNGSFRSSCSSGSSSNNKNTKDTESDVLGQQRCPSKAASSFSRNERQNNGEGSLHASIPATEGPPSIATEETDKFINTKQATMNKYKKLYIAMLDKAEKDNMKKSATRLGLGDINEDSPSISKEHNKRVANKRSFYNSGSSVNGSNDEITHGPNNDHHGVRSSKKDHLHSINIHGSSFETKPREDENKLLQPKMPNAKRLLDEIIDGLQVEELLLEGASVCPDYEHGRSLSIFTNGPTGATRNSPNKGTPAKTSDEEAVVKLSKNKRSDKSERRIDRHSGGLQDPPERSGNGSGGCRTKRSEKKRRERHRPRGARSPSVDEREGGRGRDRSRSAGPASEASVGSQRSARSDRSDKSSGGYHEKRSERKCRGRHWPRGARSPSADERESGRGRDRSRSAGLEGGRGRDRSRSAGLASITSAGSRRSNRSNRTNRRSRSGSRPRSGGSSLPRGPSHADARGGGDDSEGRTATTVASDDTTSTKQKKGLFRKMKKLAGKVKNTLGELGSGVHKFRLGERARYKVSKIPRRCSESYDPETMTVEVEIVAAHIDAVLEMPYYTIKLPNDTCKQTNWNNLIPLSEYKRRIVADRDDDPRGVPDEDRRANNSSRVIRSLSSLSRSSSKGRERSGGRRGSRIRSFFRGDEDDKSASSRRSSRSNASRRSSRSASSRRSHSKPGRSRSPNPVSRHGARGPPRSSGKGHSSRSKRRGRSPSPATKSSSARSLNTRRPSSHAQRRRS